MTTKSLTARIEVFRPGTFKPMQGEPITYSAADLRAIADAYDPETAPAPIVVGHPKADAPAYGWIEGFEYEAESERLFANVHEIEPSFADLVKAGRFKKVSMAFFSPEQGHNPVPGTWYPKHLGFLGAAAPAVSGLKNAQFSAEADTVFTAEFGERGFEETARIFRSLREWWIEKYGIEEADKALPPYRIEWLGEIEIEKPDLGMRQPAFSLPPITHQKPEKEPDVSKPTNPAFAEREANLTEREAKLAAREAKLAHDDNVAFAESLVEQGKLLPVSKDKIVAILDALPGEASVAFSEGAEKLAPADALREVLEAQPKVVTYGSIDVPPGPGDARPATFSADGQSVDSGRLETHNKALEYLRQNPGTAYLDAVQAVS